MKILLIFSFFIVWIGNNAFAGVDSAWNILRKARGNVGSYPRVVQELAEQELYYVSVPYIKEYLISVKGIKSQKIDNLIDQVITNVGVKQFEVLPIGILKRSTAPVIRYILSKKYFRAGKYSLALQSLNGTIPSDHSVKPFALFLEGSIYSISGKYKAAVASYKNCVKRTKQFMNKTKDKDRLRQLAINRDYCITGIARSQFGAKNFSEANLSYLDLPKDSFIWPEILFEEAWNSFYERDHNRTLGKLVSYKAPVLSFIFNPEVEVLKSLTFMELCLWNDAQKVVDDFYETYQNDALAVKDFISKHRKNYKFYYLMARSFSKGKSAGNELLNKMLKSVTKDAAYRELRISFEKGKNEIEILRALRKSKKRSVFLANLKEALLLQRDLIGAYVRKGLLLHIAQLDKTFRGISYIKLEVLSREKSQIYNVKHQSSLRERGDIKYLKRNEKQYFWNFNGEFWADELGDYVFSLKSECSGSGV